MQEHPDPSSAPLESCDNMDWSVRAYSVKLFKECVFLHAFLCTYTVMMTHPNFWVQVFFLIKTWKYQTLVHHLRKIKTKIVD